ncbi:MAG TPA: phage protease [bacterium]|nr:phage protease [bacterium]
MKRPYKDSNGVWHFEDVPICATGIEYPLSTGPHTFTESELAAAVEAASGEDIAINPPRIKLGHKSVVNDLFLGEDEPAFGRVEELRLSDNKQEILGNYVGTPEWLAKVLPTAFPARSVDAKLGVETATGKRYEMVVTDVSLLGVRWPGCSVLEDLPLWYGDEPPAGVEIAASADVVSIRREFYENGPGKGTNAWIRGERFDTVTGYNLIVDRDGEIVIIPVTVDGDVVSFGEQYAIVEDHTDKALAASAALRGMQLADPAMIIHASRSATEGEAMDEELRKKLALRLGLAEDATEEQIRTVLETPVGDPPPPPPEDDDGDDDGDGDEEGDGDGEETPAGTVTLDSETYAELKAGAALAQKHERERNNDRIKSEVEAAVRDGRIPPARREHWTKALTADFAGSKTVLDGLEPGLVPVGIRGSIGDGDDEGSGGGGNDQDQGFPEDWFPEIKTIRAQAETHRRVVNAKEG